MHLFRVCLLISLSQERPPHLAPPPPPASERGGSAQKPAVAARDTKKSGSSGGGGGRVDARGATPNNAAPRQRSPSPLPVPYGVRIPAYSLTGQGAEYREVERRHTRLYMAKDFTKAVNCWAKVRQWLVKRVCLAQQQQQQQQQEQQ